MPLSSAYPEANFLSTFFSELSRESVRYVVLRNAQGLPDTTGGSDLDILVDPRDAQLVRKVLDSSMHQNGGIPIGTVSSQGYLKAFLIGKSAVGDQWWGIYVDITFGIHFKVATELINSEYAEKLALTHNGIKALGNDIAGVIGVMKEVLYNGTVPVRYLASAKEGFRNDSTMLTKLLCPQGPIAIEWLRKIIESESPVYSLQYRRSLCRHSILKKPVSFFWKRFINELSKIQRFLHPPGVVIAVLGVDGVGKSTIIDAIKPVLAAATHNNLIVNHLRPGLLPPLARLKGKNSCQSSPTLNPHGSTPSGFFGSLFRMTYLMLDYILGYWLCVRPKIAKQPAVILYDRYAYDMVFDPLRFRINLPGWLTGAFVRLAPTPDLILCLYADPEVITSRKQELSLDETRRQVAALRDFASREQRAISISTEDTVMEVREQVLQTLHNFFCGRKQERPQT